jgi:hypothetical protein
VLCIEAFPYGLEANRKALEVIAAYAREQGMLREPIRIEELFAAVE